jgi:hypothetical protein
MQTATACSRQQATAVNQVPQPANYGHAFASMINLSEDMSGTQK